MYTGPSFRLHMANLSRQVETDPVVSLHPIAGFYFNLSLWDPWEERHCLNIRHYYHPCVYSQCGIWILFTEFIIQEASFFPLDFKLNHSVPHPLLQQPCLELEFFFKTWELLSLQVIQVSILKSKETFHDFQSLLEFCK